MPASVGFLAPGRLPRHFATIGLPVQYVGLSFKKLQTILPSSSNISNTTTTIIGRNDQPTDETDLNRRLCGARVS